MKKLLVIALVAAGMTACMQNEELAAPKGNAIAFENAHVENSVRALYDNSTLSSFNVYGTMSNTAQTINIFNGVEVTKNGNVWGYAADKTQYWIDGYDYNFVAVVDGVVTPDANGMPATISVDMEEQKDVLYAAVENAQHNAPVSLTFNHLLSKAKFTVSNAMTVESGFTYNVSSIEIVGADKAASYNVADGVWSATSEYNANFGAISPLAANSSGESATLLLVPGHKELEIKVTYTLKLGDAVVTNEPKVVTAALDLKAGHAYNFLLAFGNPGEKIEFDVEEVVDWVTPTVDVRFVTNAAELQAALDAAGAVVRSAADATTIYLGADIFGDVTDVQKPGRKVVIEGCGHKYEGTIKIHSNSNHYADAALTIKNVNFQTSTPDINFVEALENGAQRYSYNITVEDCSFEATGEAVNKVVGVQIKSSKDAKVKNCTATNMHSLLQAQSCDQKVEVEGCTINGKNGVAFKQVKTAVVKDSEITATAYGIRYDGNTDNYGITVSGCEVTADQPFVARKMTGSNNTVNVSGDNTFTAPEGKYEVIFTKGSDDEAYVKPEVEINSTVSDEDYSFPRDYAFPVASWDEFTAALAAGEPKVILTANITYEGTSSYNLKKNVEVNLNGKTFTTGNASTTWLNIMGSTSTFKNGVIEGKVYVQKNGSTYSNATFEKVTFGGTITFSSVTQGSLAVQGGNSVYAKDCTFKGKGSTTPNVVSLEGTSSGSVIFEGCTFNSSMNRFYANPIGGTAVFKLLNCSFNKAAVVETSANLNLNNLVIDGSKKQNVNLYIGKSKESLTDEEKAILDYIKTKTSGTVYCSGVKY